jgi:type II secretory pathway pseudopilin PulG
MRGSNLRISVRYVERTSTGVTLLELLVVFAIIAALAAAAIPVLANIRARAQRIQCTVNLRSLYVAAELYVQQNGGWPQIAVGESDDNDKDYATAWIAALKPFGVSEKNWICPTIQERLKAPNYLQPEDVRIDYAATPFDDKPMTPHQWPTHPWFIEEGDLHGHGNLIIFTDGSASDLKTVAKNAATP